MYLSLFNIVSLGKYERHLYFLGEEKQELFITKNIFSLFRLL